MPHFAQKTKKSDTVEKVPTHLMAGLLPRYGVFGYLFYEQWPKDANLVCTVLVDILQRLAEDGAHFGHSHTLNIQADNAAENKNFHLIALLCCLVEWRCFKEINLNFLMVGHTHEDIDQMFSRFSTALGKHNAITIPELKEVFESCYKTASPYCEEDSEVHTGPSSVAPRKKRKVNTEQEASIATRMIILESCYDYKRWTRNYCKVIHGISKPHCFNISVNAPDVVYTI